MLIVVQAVPSQFNYRKAHHYEKKNDGGQSPPLQALSPIKKFVYVPTAGAWGSLSVVAPLVYNIHLYL